MDWIVLSRRLGRISGVLLMIFSAPIYAASLLNHQLNADGSILTLSTDEGQVAIRAIGAGTLVVDYQPNGLVQLPSFAVDESAVSGSGKVVIVDDKIHFQLADIQAVIQPQPFNIAYYRGDSLLTREAPGLVIDDNSRGFHFSLSADEKLMGGGQRVLEMNRRGQRMPLYNKASYGYTSHADQMYYGLPAVMSDRHYALVFDNSASGWLDIGHRNVDLLSFEAMGGRTSYLISAGADYPALISNFTAAVGRQPLPPRWALGNFASRFGYRTEKETREVVAQFAQQDIPLDAVVLDLYWFGKDIKGHMGNLAWDLDAWPTPTKMIRDFAGQGVKTVMITEPFILTNSNRWDEAVAADALATTADGQPQTFDFYFGNSGLVDVFSESGQQWFWQAYQRLLAQGVAGWWGDLGEPELHPAQSQHKLSASNQRASGDEIHNAYGHQWGKMVAERLQQAQPDKRPMIMMRSGFVGSQRYGMIPWSGDVSRSWGGLQPQVQLSLQMGMLGLGYHHSDLGGFAGGEVFDPELYARWLQYGVFQPIYRPHGQDHIPSEPIFHTGEVKRIVRDFIKLRYRLLPYIYTLAYHNSTTGMPLMRPLLMDQANLFDVDDVYRFGDAFVVAPITNKGLTEVSFDLPEGIFFDFFNGQRYQGGQRVTVPVSAETIPVLVQAGSFVPMVAAVQSTKDYSSAELELHYYFDRAVTKGQGQMYEDDGQDPDAISERRYELLQFEAASTSKTLQIDLRRGGGDYDGKPEQRKVLLYLHHLPAPHQITLGDNVLPWQQQDGAVLVPLRWGSEDQQITVQFQP